MSQRIEWIDLDSFPISQIVLWSSTTRTSFTTVAINLILMSFGCGSLKRVFLVRAIPNLRDPRLVVYLP